MLYKGRGPEKVNIRNFHSMGFENKRKNQIGIKKENNIETFLNMLSRCVPDTNFFFEYDDITARFKNLYVMNIGI